MVRIGEFNKLKVVEQVDFGTFLDGGDDGDILLPKREVPAGCEVGQELEVFVYLDSEDRLIATTKAPLAKVGEFAVLKVAAVNAIGAFLSWGLPKDLLLPFAEQTRPLRVGQIVIVYLYLDKSDRISASMRLDRFAEKNAVGYQQGQQVDLLIIGRTDLGFKAIVNGRHIGILYANEVFQPLNHGQSLPGFIKQVRPDGKIDLMLKPTGRKAAKDEIQPKILKLLEEEGGFLAINDKTTADTIHDLFGVSKKKYKIALGGLYKQRLITVDEDGIRLVKK